MKKGKVTLVILVLAIVSLAAPAWWFGVDSQRIRHFLGADPDLPSQKADKLSGEREEEEGEGFDKEGYLQRRIEQTDHYQGFDTAEPDSRPRAIRELELQEKALEKRSAEGLDGPLLAWTPLGPAPIPAGQTTGRADPVSGRTTAIAVNPTNPNIVFVGTAQGGLYRTLDAGATWTPLMDNAQSLAIGAVAIAPSDPTTVYVGTGESTQCGSGCFIGVGVYRIDNANTSPVVSGPFNHDGSNADVLSGRAISEILVDPIDKNTIFVGTTSGIAGIGSNTTGLTLPTRGVYRSSNAASGAPIFTSIFNINRNVTDLAMDPADHNRIYAGVIGDGFSVGAGVFTSANALDPSPSFTQVLTQSVNPSASQGRIELSAVNVSGVTTVYAATGEANGSLYRSVNNTFPFSLRANNSYCAGQCFYDIAVAIDPTNADIVYLGGSPNMAFGRSINGGTSFTRTETGLHVDTQVITVAPSSPATVYFGSDGGIWRSIDSGANWTALNNTTYSATQFMSIAIHPVDANYSLGGTQDNGTELYTPQGNWLWSDGGDGGFAVIDQTATGLNDTVAYHTYFNATNSPPTTANGQIGFNRGSAPDPTTGDLLWGTKLGCGSGWIPNGITCTDATLFYAPMVGGPVATDSAGKNTLYFGTNKLYRSGNLGTTMTVASQTLTGSFNGAPERVSAIGIAPSNDAVRLIGSTIGRVYYSNTAGATTMTDVTGVIPARYVGRIAIHPTNPDIAYVALNGYGIPNQHVMKTTNLGTGSPSWTNAGVGIPDVPTNALVIDPANPNVIYAGTDIGVYRSQDAGATWVPFGTGLPRVAVFGMAIHNPSRVLRIATHGKGMWQISINIPATITVSGTVKRSNGQGVTDATISLTDPDGLVRTTKTDRQGRYFFDNVPSGRTYTVAASNPRYSFGPPQTVTPFDAVTTVNFVAQ